MNTYHGVVQEGSRKASALGFPTVNIELADDEGVSGSYAALVRIGGETYTAVAYGDPSRKLLEAHLFSYSKTLYGETVSIELLEKIRESERFEDDAAMREAIRGDVGQAQHYFTTHNV
ncbi:MAG: riboflavin kinase [Patescibacteria group bacterium]|nr:riboflavin kinase [Patescibacteria group bacterium]MDE1965868.1 riboflavin kinase [Patescibacteria group bacterium]